MRGVQRLICLALLYVILYMAGVATQDGQGWVLWTAPLLVIVLEHLAHIQGVVEGFEIYRKLTESQRAEIERMLKDD